MDLSVIIPVYNVQAYLEQCVQSVCSQDFVGSSVEIILVDDCSTDSSGALCDSLAQKDDRVRVIHKGQNEGLGMARNTGLDAATGRFILFLDSDDWLRDGALAAPLSLIKKHKVDIIEFRCALAYPEYYRWPQETGKTQEYTCEQAIESLLRVGDISSVAWDKIYSKSLFDSVRFSATRFNEDTEIMYLVLAQCARVMFLDQVVVMYRQRAGSLAQNEITMRRADFNIEVYSKQEAYCETHFPALVQTCAERVFVKALVQCHRVAKNRDTKQWYYQKLAFVRQQYSKIQPGLHGKKKLVYGVAGRMCGRSIFALLRPCLRMYLKSSLYRPMMGGKLEKRTDIPIIRSVLD